MVYPATGQLLSIDEREPRPGMKFVSLNIGDGKRYEVGKFAPRDVQPGDTITFNYETTQNGQYTNYKVVARSIRKIEGSVQAAPAQEAKAAPPTASTGKREYVAFDERQDIISKQAALNTAQNFVTFAAAQGAVEFTKTTKPDERLTLLRAWWLDEASKVYKLSTGRDWDVPEQDAAQLPQERRAAKAKPVATPETSMPDSGHNEFPEDDIPF